MVKSFFQAICQMGIFMICAQAIIHFRPNGSYEKYMKMLVSVMILVQIFLPVTRLFSAGAPGLEDRISWFEQQMKESMKAAEQSMTAADEILRKMTLEEIKLQLYNNDSGGMAEDIEEENMDISADEITDAINEEENMGKPVEVEPVKVKLE